MGSISSRENGTLFFDFRYLGQRCKEYTKLKNTPPNKKRLEQILARIEAEITLGSFDYAKYFPDSSKVALFNKRKSLTQAADTDSPLFKDFAETWYSENIVRWRKSHSQMVRSTLDNYLIPEFGEKTIQAVNKAELLGFRAGLARIERKDGSKGLSNERINHIMTPLRMILTEAADRYEFTSPWRGIKSLKVPRTEVEPFTLEEVRKIINAVRADFRNYYTVRFFTGLRTGEIDGLLWKYVDFERRQILVRESYVAGEMTTTKTDGSQREIEMRQLVFDALSAQREVTGHFDYVFCTGKGQPLDHNNITKRVWYPLLRLLDLKKRRPYQTRHTAATLWLGAGENPEWIARQMGHTTTEMLFRVYSRYVPNLTRRDGSAMERLLQNHF